MTLNEFKAWLEGICHPYCNIEGWGPCPELWELIKKKLELVESNCGCHRPNFIYAARSLPALVPLVKDTVPNPNSASWY